MVANVDGSGPLAAVELPYLLEAAARFGLTIGPDGIRKLGRGLINETFLIGPAEPIGIAGHVDSGRRYVLQRINASVFERPEAVMQNIERVSAHLADKWRQRPVADPERRYLRLLTSEQGQHSWQDPGGHWWRVFRHVDGSIGLQQIDDLATAWQAGLAFGRFMADLDDLPGPPLQETITGFHDTSGRLASMEQAFAEDPLGRAASLDAEHQRLLRGSALVTDLAQLQQAACMPLRVVHNDTKVDNLLFDRQSGEALCVIDLDTVMPGLALHDFGDMVRNGACSLNDNGVPSFSLAKFEALTSGYLTGSAGLLTSSELAFLPQAGPLLALELAARFVTDYLLGDRYFKTDFPAHNLQRCRGQLNLMDVMMKQSQQMSMIVERVANDVG